MTDPARVRLRQGLQQLVDHPALCVGGGCVGVWGVEKGGWTASALRAASPQQTHSHHNHNHHSNHTATTLDTQQKSHPPPFPGWSGRAWCSVCHRGLTTGAAAACRRMPGSRARPVGARRATALSPTAAACCMVVGGVIGGDARGGS